MPTGELLWVSPGVSKLSLPRAAIWSEPLAALHSPQGGLEQLGLNLGL